MALESELSTLGALLQDRTARHGVVGAALAVGRGDEIFEAATGLVNRNTGVEVTVDSVFQIGSITKLFTTTLIMQLFDEGSLELDAPVKRYLPEFQLADSKATEEITPARYAGCYERLATGYEVAVENGSLVLDAVGRRPPMSLLPPARSALRAIAPDAFVVEYPGALVSSPILFSRFAEDGHPGYLHAGLRAAPRLNHGRKT